MKDWYNTLKILSYTMIVLLTVNGIKLDSEKVLS